MLLLFPWMQVRRYMRILFEHVSVLGKDAAVMESITM